MLCFEHMLDHLEEIIARFYFSVFLFIGIFVYELMRHVNGTGLIPVLLMPLYLASIVASITCLWSFKKTRFYSLVPLAVNIVSFLLPSARDKVDYYYYKHDREAIVREICKDTTYQSTDYKNIDTPNSNISDTFIQVEVHSRIRYVMFYTNLPLLMTSSNYDGYLYVQNGGNPTQFKELSNTKRAAIRQLDDNWFEISYR